LNPAPIAHTHTHTHTVPHPLSSALFFFSLALLLSTPSCRVELGGQFGSSTPNFLFVLQPGAPIMRVSNCFAPELLLELAREMGPKVPAYLTRGDQREVRKSATTDRLFAPQPGLLPWSADLNRVGTAGPSKIRGTSAADRELRARPTQLLCSTRRGRRWRAERGTNEEEEKKEEEDCSRPTDLMGGRAAAEAETAGILGGADSCAGRRILSLCLSVSLSVSRSGSLPGCRQSRGENASLPWGDPPRAKTRATRVEMTAETEEAKTRRRKTAGGVFGRGSGDAARKRERLEEGKRDREKKRKERVGRREAPSDLHHLGKPDEMPNAAVVASDGSHSTAGRCYVCGTYER